MAAIQIISAWIGWRTGSGLARNIALQLPRPALYLLVALLVIANTINIAADLAAMGASSSNDRGSASQRSRLCSNWRLTGLELDGGLRPELATPGRSPCARGMSIVGKTGHNFLPPGMA
jgi:hypothetical protein